MSTQASWRLNHLLAALSQAEIPRDRLKMEMEPQGPFLNHSGTVSEVKGTKTNPLCQLRSLGIVPCAGVEQTGDPGPCLTSDLLFCLHRKDWLPKCTTCMDEEAGHPKGLHLV
jgi:hypothetical protein